MLTDGCLKLAFVFCIMLFVSCRRDEPCTEAWAMIYYVSFPENHTDSIILKKYAKDNNFDSLISTTVISKSNSIYKNPNDTLSISDSTTGADYTLDIAHDYEVYMPNSNQLFKISGITQQQTSIRVGLSLDKRGCVNPIISYTLNGKLINPSSNIIYIKN